MAAHLHYPKNIPKISAANPPPGSREDRLSDQSSRFVTWITEGPEECPDNS
jgi:hypothetical protein